MQSLETNSLRCMLNHPGDHSRTQASALREPLSALIYYMMILPRHRTSLQIGVVLNVREECGRKICFTNLNGIRLEAWSLFGSPLDIE